jgi:hypothetical protein
MMSARRAKLEALIKKNELRRLWNRKYRRLKATCRLCRKTGSVYGDEIGDLWMLRLLGMPDDFWEMSQVCGDCWEGIVEHFRRHRICRNLDHRIDDVDLVSCLAWFVARPPKWLREQRANRGGVAW